MPGKIFDAKCDFGAKADGKADDTEAVQRAIDAAREHGKGAMAYLPAGQYKISKTIEVGGSNWSLAGTALEATGLTWSGEAGGTLMHVADPDHVTIENIAVGRGTPNTPAKNAEDILQTSSGAKPSFITYDRVYVYGEYYQEKAGKPAEHYQKRGVHFKGLGKNDTALLTYIGGNFRAEDSAPPRQSYATYHSTRAAS